MKHIFKTLYWLMVSVGLLNGCDDSSSSNEDAHKNELKECREGQLKSCAEVDYINQAGCYLKNDKPVCMDLVPCTVGSSKFVCDGATSEVYELICLQKADGTTYYEINEHIKSCDSCNSTKDDCEASEINGDECDPQTFVNKCDGNSYVNCVDLGDSFEILSYDCSRFDEICAVKNGNANCYSYSKKCDPDSTPEVNYCYKNETWTTSYIESLVCTKAYDGQYYLLSEENSCPDNGYCGSDVQCHDAQACDAHVFKETCENNIIVRCNPAFEAVDSIDCNLQAYMNKETTTCHAVNGKYSCYMEHNRCTDPTQKKGVCVDIFGISLYYEEGCILMDDGSMFDTKGGTMKCVNGCNEDNTDCDEAGYAE